MKHYSGSWCFKDRGDRSGVSLYAQEVLIYKVRQSVVQSWWNRKSSILEKNLILPTTTKKASNTAYRKCEQSVLWGL